MQPNTIWEILICIPTGYMTCRWHPKCLGWSQIKDEQLFDSYDKQSSENEVLERLSEEKSVI